MDIYPEGLLMGSFPLEPHYFIFMLPMYKYLFLMLLVDKEILNKILIFLGGWYHVNLLFYELGKKYVYYFPVTLEHKR